MSVGLTIVVSLALVFLARNADAVTWSLKNAITNDTLNNLPRNHVDPDSDDALTCVSPGTCIPSKINLPLQTLFYWCGWKTIYRSRYIVKVTNTSKDANFSAVLMRSKDLYGCAFSPNVSAGLSGFKSCVQVAFTLCDTVSSCTLQAGGIAFPDDLCFLLAVNGNATVNKNKTGANLTFQFYNFYDSSRYYGTVFSIILTILGFGSVLVYIGYTCYHEYTQPNDRIQEYRNLEAKLAAGDHMDDPVAEKERQPSIFQIKVASAMEKVRKSFRRKDMTR